MTPQLTESIKILQMGSLELIPYITNQIEQNPFLEREEGASNKDTQPDEHTESPQESEKIQSIDKAQQNWEDDEVSPAIYENESLIYSGSGSKTQNSNEQSLDYIESRSLTLREYIIEQINVDIKDYTERMIALHLTEYLDENGYIIYDSNALCQILRCAHSNIEQVITKLQKLDPPGVFARSLTECLALQLKDKDRLDPAMQALLANLELMAKFDLKNLKKICGVDEEDLKQMFAEIKELNPRPGNNFSSEHTQILQVDIFLKKDQNAGWLIELNSDALPRVLVNRRYYSIIDAQVTDKESKKFLSQHLNTANWLAKALDQRANTILKVATEIVVQQDEFFRRGIHHLRPLIISDIADVVGMHESTVSRVINGKYIATHMGTYELKYFFSSGIGAAGNSADDVSSKRIKHMIKQLVEAEIPNKVLSDDKIASLLEADGVLVARRTVMKYREAMNIPSSVQRRREKILV